MSQKTFLLGLGTQKAGTSWLQAHLSTHAEVDFGPIKEYHVFNALHLPAYAHVLERRDPRPWHQPRQFISQLRRNFRISMDEALRRRLRREGEYYQYFNGILKQPSVRLTGDMTPDYAGLDRKVLSDVRTGFGAFGITAQAIFLMRDPVERCLSAVRMYHGRKFSSHRLPISAENSISDSLSRLFETRHFEDLSRYDRTLTEMEAAFPEQDRLVGFYEELFSEEEVARIERFLGLPEGRPDLGKRVNASGFKDEGIDPDLRARIANHYRPVYEDMFRRFGEERVRGLWSSAALLD